MTQPGRESASASPRPASRWRRGRLVVALVVLVGGVTLVAWWRGALGRADAGPLTGDLVVNVLAPTGGGQSTRVEEAGAVPVRAGHEMGLEVRLNQPAYVYLIWIDSRAQVVPLYPWNNETVTVKDVGQPPPQRKAARTVFSPMYIGTGWSFGKAGGMETVLLLARRTPLDEDTRLEALLAPLPAAPVRQPGEVAVLGRDRGADAVSLLVARNRGSEDEALTAEEPLRQLLSRLSVHFEMIRAVRFAHEGE